MPPLPAAERMTVNCFAAAEEHDLEPMSPGQMAIEQDFIVVNRPQGSLEQDVGVEKDESLLSEGV